MTEKMMSPFQNIGCQMCDFLFKNHKYGTFDKKSISHQIDGSFIVADYSDNCWNGGIAIHYLAKDNEKCDFQLKAEINAYFVYQADETDEEKARFVKLMKMNGAFSVLAIFRAHIAAATSALGMQPGLIVPNINLNELSWTEAKE